MVKNKKVKLVLALTINSETLNPYLISDDEIEVGDIVCESLLTNEYLAMTVQTINDIDNNTQKKVIATPEQIGYIGYDERFINEFYVEEYKTSVRLINDNDILNIINNDGICTIQMEVFEGDYCGYRKIKYLNNKVLINIKK